MNVMDIFTLRVEVLPWFFVVQVSFYSQPPPQRVVFILLNLIHSPHLRGTNYILDPYFRGSDSNSGPDGHIFWLPLSGDGNL